MRQAKRVENYQIINIEWEIKTTIKPNFVLVLKPIRSPIKAKF